MTENSKSKFDIASENLIFDFLAINAFEDTYIDQEVNERFLVHQYDNDKFSLIAGNNGIAIKTTREIARNMNNFSLYVDGNAYMAGTLYTSNIKLLGTDLQDCNIGKLIESINENTSPWIDNGSVLVDNELRTNYYIPHYITVGNQSSTIDNLNALNISYEANSRISKSQLAIRNKYGNPLTGQKSELLLGILGDNYYSPAIISTSQGKSLEFYVSESGSNIDVIYEKSHLPKYSKGVPAMLIDTSKGVSINTSNSINIEYNLDDYTSNNEVSKLNVNGMGYIKNICMTDSYDNTIRHLNDIFVKRRGVTIHPHQIYPGTFNGDFVFSSNTSMTDLTSSTLTVDDTTELYGDRLSVFCPSYFNDSSLFESIQTEHLNIVGTLQKNGSNLNITEIESRYISYSVEDIRKKHTR